MPRSREHHHDYLPFFAGAVRYRRFAMTGCRHNSNISCPGPVVRRADQAPPEIRRVEMLIYASLIRPATLNLKD
jgi:hypothetical protein